MKTHYLCNVKSVMCNVKRADLCFYITHYTIHITQSIPLLVFLVICFSSISLCVAAPGSYEQVTEQLSQAVATYKTLNQQQDRYDVVFRRDPMKALVDAQGNLVTSIGLRDGLSVQGVIWSEERPLAIVDDGLFAQGDRVADYSIREIRRDGITVQRGTEILVIPLERGIELSQPTPQPSSTEPPTQPSPSP